MHIMNRIGGRDVGGNPLIYSDIRGLDASLYPKDSSFADPSDHVAPVEPQSCETDCQRVRIVYDVKTIEEADRLNRNGDLVSIGAGVVISGAVAFCAGPAGLGILGAGGASTAGSAAGASFGISGALNRQFVYPGDRLVYEYTLCCNSDSGSAVSSPSYGIIRGGAGK